MRRHSVVLIRSEPRNRKSWCDGSIVWYWRRVSGFLILQVGVLLLAGMPTRVQAQAVLWQIGTFDRSAAEFNSHMHLDDPSVTPTFAIGRSSPAHDWPALQPGSGNKAMGRRPHPYSILFTLVEPPRAVYRLSVSALLYSTCTPSLLVEINGTSGVFYFTRKLSYYPGDRSAYSPIYSEAYLDVILPTAALRRGPNRLALTALDSESEACPDSTLAYDALRLTQDPPGGAQIAPMVEVAPTLFYVNKNGRLYEETYVTVSLSEKVREGEVALVLGETRFRTPLSSEYDFGQQRYKFTIPELAASASALVSLSLNKRTYLFPIRIEPQRKWKLYVVPNIHVDVGFTDYQAKVAELHSRNVDRLIQAARKDPDVRFSLDGSWIAEEFLSTRSSAARDEFFRLARSGEVSIPAQYLHLLTGYASLEELIRSFGYAHQLHRDHGISFTYANHTDVPCCSWSYASVLSHVGVNELAIGSNSERSLFMLDGHWNEKSPFWWQGPDGAKVLMSVSRMYAHLSFLCGRPPEAAACREALPVFMQAFDSPSYKPDAVLIYGSQFENSDVLPGVNNLVKAWNLRYAYPKMVLAGFPDYLHYVERTFGSSLKTITGDGGPSWEDGLGTDAHYVAIHRENQQRATSAEKLSTVATFLNATLAAPVDRIRRMWLDGILFGEHTFTSWGGYSRPGSDQTVRQLATKEHLVLDGRETVNAIVDGSLSQLAEQIRMAARSLVVFNPLNWRRNALVEIDIDSGQGIFEYSTGEPVRVEVLRHTREYDHLRFLATDVPSLGFKCYRIAPTKQTTKNESESALPITNILENSYYRVEVDPSTGAVSQLFDKELRRDLVDRSSPYHLNQYMYVRGGNEESSRIVHLNRSVPPTALNIGLSGPGHITRVQTTPYGKILTVRSSAPQTPCIESDIVLFNAEKKVEFVNRVHKTVVFEKEAVYFAFAFAVENPGFSYEIQNGWVDPARNMLKGGNLEWFTVHHCTRIAGPGLSIGLVPIDAPLVTFGDINRGMWPERFEPRSATVFSYVMNNYWYFNFRGVQGGDFTFRYALTSGRDLAPEFLACFGRAAMTPMESGQLLIEDKVGNPERPLQPIPTSYLELDKENVVVENWKAAEDGRGTILRLLETGGRRVSVRLNFPLFDLRRAWIASGAEQDRQEITVAGHLLETTLNPHEIVTLRILASGTHRWRKPVTLNRSIPIRGARPRPTLARLDEMP